MKKFITILLLSFLFCSNGFTQTYYFKECKLSNSVLVDYIINLDKKLIEVTLKGIDETIQSFSDKIKVISFYRVFSPVKMELSTNEDL